MELKFLPFFFFSTGLAGIGASVILISSKKYLLQNIYLSLCIFSLSLCSIYNFCYMEGLLTHVPFLFIIAKAITYLVAPCAYLYIRNIFRPADMYRPYDWLHFAPFVIVILVLTNISLRDSAAIQRALADSSVNWFVDSSQAGWYYALSVTKSLMWLFYTFLQSICIINFERRRHDTPLRYNYRLVNWLKIFNITLIILFSSLLVQRFVNITFISLDFVSDTTMSFILLLTLGFLVSNPHILYSLEHMGLNLTIEPQTEPVYVYTKKNKLIEEEKVIVVKKLFSTKKKEEYLLILDDVLLQSRPYLNKGITVKDLAEQTGIPAHHLSSLISSEFNLHFQDFINLRRIEYLKSNINDISWRQLTLEGICWEIGFTSRTTFFRAFIKFTGLSPSEYFNTLKKNRPKAS